MSKILASLPSRKRQWDQISGPSRFGFTLSRSSAIHGYRVSTGSSAQTANGCNPKGPSMVAECWKPAVHRPEKVVFRCCHVDYVIAEKHGGDTLFEKLALAFALNSVFC